RADAAFLPSADSRQLLHASVHRLAVYPDHAGRRPVYLGHRFVEGFSRANGDGQPDAVDLPFGLCLPDRFHAVDFPPTVASLPDDVADRRGPRRNHPWRRLEGTLAALRGALGHGHLLACPEHASLQEAGELRV